MWIEGFFNKEDKKVKDKCPVCKEDFGTAYLKTERIYYCGDCKKIVEFHPFEKIPIMKPKKQGSHLDTEYQPFEEDMRLHMQDNPQEGEDPPQDPPTSRGWWA
jgi:hypothetical protein